MNFSTNRNLPNRVRYSTVSPYNNKIYYAKVKKYNKSNRKIKKGKNNYLPPTFKYLIPSQNNFTNLSLINGFNQNNSNFLNNSSYNYTINPNKSNSVIYNSYIKNPIHRSTFQVNTYPNAKILPSEYLGQKVLKSKILNNNGKFKMNKASINFGYNNKKIISRKPYNQPVQNIIMSTEKVQKKKYSPIIDIPSYSTIQLSTPQISPYSTQQIFNPHVPFYSTQQIPNYYTPKISNYSTPHLFTKKVDNHPTSLISNNSILQSISYTSQQNNTYNNNKEYETATIKNQLNYQSFESPKKNVIINKYNTIDTNINTIKDKIISDSNIIAQEKGVEEEDKKLYQEQIETKSDYLINSSEIYKEQTETESPKYNSYIYNSPEITYKMNYLFSPIQSPLANYETQSYNGDNNIDIEEMLKLKEENEEYKRKIQELEDKYQAKKEEEKELRIQVDQLSPIKDKLSEIELLKSQLFELKELTNKVNQLEMLKYNIEEKDINKQKDEEKQLVIQKQDTIGTIKSETKSLKLEIKKKDNNKQNKFDEELENNKNKTELNLKNVPKYVKGEIIHSMEELIMIIEKINNNNTKMNLNLLYKATADSGKAKIFHKKCDNAESSIVLIETDIGKRFGGFTSVNWRGKCINKKDKKSFVFSLDNMKIYENISEEKAIGCYPKFGPVFLGCQIRIYDNAFKNGGTTCKKGYIFDTHEDYELTGGKREFKIKEIEVYEVIAQ